MKLEYESIIESSAFILTNFKCQPAQQLLKDKGFYKILWAREKACSLMVDGFGIDYHCSQESEPAQLPKSQQGLVRKYHILVAENSPLQVINERIILEAKRLLLYSGKTAEEIGFELGYGEAAHFSKFFKSNAGLPPAQFEERHWAGK